MAVQRQQTHIELINYWLLLLMFASVTINWKYHVCNKQRMNQEIVFAYATGHRSLQVAPNAMLCHNSFKVFIFCLNKCAPRNWSLLKLPWETWSHLKHSIDRKMVRSLAIVGSVDAGACHDALVVDHLDHHHNYPNHHQYHYHHRNDHWSWQNWVI